jgi:hypothetical protein
LGAGRAVGYVAGVDKTLPDPGFAGDDGAADPDLVRALAVYAGDGRSAPVLVAIARARVLVPVVALLGEVEHDPTGLVRDKTADIAAVLMQGQDGRTALLAFTAVSTLRAFDPQARPVPVSIGDAARSAVQEGAEALLVDVAGPTSFVVETAELHELAAGRVLTPTAAGYAWLSGIARQM